MSPHLWNGHDNNAQIMHLLWRFNETKNVKSLHSAWHMINTIYSATCFRMQINQRRVDKSGINVSMLQAFGWSGRIFPSMLFSHWVTTVRCKYTKKAEHSTVGRNRALFMMYSFCILLLASFCSWNEKASSWKSLLHGSLGSLSILFLFLSH